MRGGASETRGLTAAGAPCGTGRGRAIGKRQPKEAWGEVPAKRRLLFFGWLGRRSPARRPHRGVRPSPRVGAAGVPSAVAGTAAVRSCPVLSAYQSASGGVSSGSSSLANVGVAGSSPVSCSRFASPAECLARRGFPLHGRGSLGHSFSTLPCRQRASRAVSSIRNGEHRWAHTLSW